MLLLVRRGTVVLPQVSLTYDAFLLRIAHTYLMNTAVFRPTAAISRLQLLDIMQFSSTLIFLNKVMSKLNYDKNHLSLLLFTILA